MVEMQQITAISVGGSKQQETETLLFDTFQVRTFQ